LSATGRADKSIGQPGLSGPFADDPRAGFYAGGAPTPNPDNAPVLTEGYIETFEYDPVGNMLRLHYQANSGQWARRFGMGGQTPDQWADANSNRLTSLVNGPDTLQYQFDANGNLIQQNTEKQHAWDHADRMIGFQVQPTASNPSSIEARYLYGADGMRVKKWVRNQQRQVHTSTYIDGLFEHHCWQKDGGGQNNALHVMDDQSRIAIVRVGLRHPEDGGERVQYHLGDHLGSSHVEVGGDDVNGHAFINCEEYFPYGETSFCSFGRKRYRYSGKERDEESGLYYYGARYLAPWLGRWASCDPIELDGDRGGKYPPETNPYIYVSNRPLTLIDPDGLKSRNFVVYMTAQSGIEAKLAKGSRQYAESFRSKGYTPIGVSSLDDMVNQLNSSLGEEDTIGTVIIVTHGREFEHSTISPSGEVNSTESTELFLPSQEGKVNKRDMPVWQSKDTLQEASQRLRIPLRNVQGKTDEKSELQFHGCNLGKDPEMLRTLGRFFGGKGITVTAPVVGATLSWDKKSIDLALNVGRERIGYDSPAAQPYMATEKVDEPPLDTRIRHDNIDLGPKKDYKVPDFQANP
jgi:RHS repeat-associated protein